MEREVLGQKDRKRRCRKVEKSRDGDLLADVLQINKTWEEGEAEKWQVREK